MNFIFQISQPLVFIAGKGGTGRTSVAAAMAKACAAQGEDVLVVQWAAADGISYLFSSEPCAHEAVFLKKLGVHVMNFNPKEAVREYFTEHLGLKILYHTIIENRHVQKLIHAAPGISELFFLGRLFWLVELAADARGKAHDRVIVDLPAMGHGVPLFNTAATVARLGVTGPLAIECERVNRLLTNPQKTAVCVVTLPEELPLEETREFVPKIRNLLGFNPAACFINRAVRSTTEGFDELSQQAHHTMKKFHKKAFSHALGAFWKAIEYREAQQDAFERWSKQEKTPAIPLPDISFGPESSGAGVILGLAQHLQEAKV